MSDDEVWRPVPGFENYEVSDLGRVRSKRRTHVRPHWLTGKPIEVAAGGRVLDGWVTKQSNGSPLAVLVTLRRDGRSFTDRVHRLVLLAFIGPSPDGTEGCHNDGNPLNNRLSNLRWDTHEANMLDAARHGTKKNPPVFRGERHHNATLTDNQVAAIRALPRRRGLLADLAREYGTSANTIGRIRAGLTRVPHH